MEEFRFTPKVKVEDVKVTIWECNCAKCGKILDFYGRQDADDHIILKITPCDCIKNGD
jgi:hypothetical protein